MLDIWKEEHISFSCDNPKCNSYESMSDVVGNRKNLDNSKGLVKDKGWILTKEYNHFCCEECQTLTKEED